MRLEFGIAQVFVEWTTMDELHREKPLVALVHELVEADQVWVADVSQLAELVLEAIDVERVRFADRLEGNAGPALTVEGLVDDPHSSLAKLALDQVATRPLELE